MLRSLLPQVLRAKKLALASAVTAAVALPQLANAELVFNKISTFDVMEGNGSGVAEITDASGNGQQLVYTDAENSQIGFVRIANPYQPKAQGVMDLDGEPTSLVLRGGFVLVGVNTSESFTNPSGKLVIINRFSREVVREIDLGGQPDSVAISPDKMTAAIVIENERDEDLNDGLLPQLPSGGLMILDMKGAIADWTLRQADLSPVADAAPAGSDLEPEFVDINDENEAVITFQENNYLAVVALNTGATINHFSAGSAIINNVDNEEEDLINFDTTLEKRREPDAVTWINNDVFATANEGDYEDENGDQGGSRSFTLFHQDGSIHYEAAESFEHWLASMGHYLDGRSENKGCEPEGIEAGVFGNKNLLFVGSERCNAVGVYDVTSGTPVPLQILPTGIGPEGLKAIAQRGLFIASTESEVADDGIPTMINVFSLKDSKPLYPSIESKFVDGTPIPWVALSGMAADPADETKLYAVSDSFLAEGFIYTIDNTQRPALITERLQVTGASADLDLEGIAKAEDGNFWLGSEGNSDSRPNLVLQVSPQGEVLQEIQLPAELVDQRRSNGIEGIAVTGAAGAEVVYVAIQRAWPDEGDVDGVNTKIGRYDVATGTWGFVHYPLEAEGMGGWVGLSELTLLPNGKFAVIERDKGWGPSTGPVAELKALYTVDLANADFRPYGETLAMVEKSFLYDALPILEKRSIWTAEKLEGFAVTPKGRVFAVTDNDGVDDATGETVFLRLGVWKQLVK
ncbi:esterase-like activity of phytase family protein [Halioxenophilus aromaticivorans]|uniref:Esterase-like activity of phytase family protein n=1 Tax=Halioxenophilus aromaticivorans TaxID=1306992 RepID=A0AAV3TZ28_9ALTE